MAQEADSYTTLKAVEGRVKRGTFSADSVPTRDEVLVFMADRAGQVTAAARSAGSGFTTPSGGSPPTDPETLRLCDLANNMLAAGDCIAAIAVRADSGDQVPSTADAYWKQGMMAIKSLKEFLRNVDDGSGTRPGGRGRIHTRDGGIEAGDYAPEGFNSERDRRALFSLDTEW